MSSLLYHQSGEISRIRHRPTYSFSTDFYQLPRNCKKKLPVSREIVTTFAKLEIDLMASPLHPPDPGNVVKLIGKFIIPVAASHLSMPSEVWQSAHETSPV